MARFNVGKVMDHFAHLASLRASAAKKRQGRLLPATAVEEVPPGQITVDKFPVLTAGSTPQVDLATWTLQFSGLVENALEFTHQEFLELPTKKITADFHCVTAWSRLRNVWEGVGFKDLMDDVGPKPEAKYVMVLCYGGYTTNLPLEVLLDPDTLLAFRHDGQDLTPEHGWPLRLVVPKRYGWKSAKWVREFEFMDEDEPGFWEIRGYHNDGDPWQEERFST